MSRPIISPFSALSVYGLTSLVSSSQQYSNLGKAVKHAAPKMEGPEDITRVRARNALKVSHFIHFQLGIQSIYNRLCRSETWKLIFHCYATLSDPTGRPRRHSRAKRRLRLQITSDQTLLDNTTRFKTESCLFMQCERLLRRLLYLMRGT